MNWLIREKMFTYFYNKFRPVNRMYYIKCGVNSSLLSQFWLLQVCGTLDHCFITTGVIYKCTLVWYSAKQGTMHRPTSHLAHLYIVPFVWPQEEHGQQRSWVDDFAGHCLLLRLWSQKTFFSSESGVSNRNFTDGFLIEFDSFPGHCNRHLQRSALFTLLCMTRHSCSNPIPLRYERLLQWQQNRSKTAMCLV
jgi:hypothetical protein